MKAQYAWIVLLFLAGLSLTYFLLPSDEEIALLEFKGGRYEEARAFYEGQYEQGRLEPKIVFPLIQIELGQGNIDRAICLMNGLAADYPKDLNVLRTLADLYQTNHQYEQYYSILLQLEPLDPTPETLQGLAFWYEINNQPDCLLPILQKLVLRESATSDNLQMLGHLYAARKNYEKSYAALETLRTRFPQNTKLSDIFLEIWVLMEISKAQGKNRELEKRATDILADYLLKNKKTKDVYYALGTYGQSYPSLAPALIAQLKPVIQEHPPLERLALELLWERSIHQTAVYHQALELYAANPSDPEIQNFLTHLFLEKKEICPLLHLLQNACVENFDERTLVTLVIFAIEQNKPFLVREIQTSLSNQYLKMHPMIAISLAIGAQEADARENLYQFLHTPVPSQTDRYYLLKVSAAANYSEEVLELGCALFPFIGLHDYQLMNIAHAYIQMEKTDLLYAMVENAIPTIGKRNGEGALALMDISQHRSQKVADWLKKEEVNEGILDELYSQAVEKKEYPLALYIAKRRVQEDPNPIKRADYALALVRVHLAEEGLSLLKEIYSDDPDDPVVEIDYLDALVFAAKENPIYKEPLLSFMKKRKKPSDELLRAFGFVYLDGLHDFPKGEAIFRSLSEKEYPEDADVQTLVYLWGPRASSSQIQWIEERALASCPENLGFWLQHLVYVGAPEKVIEIFEGHSTGGSSAFFAYLDALLLEKKECALRQAIDRAFPYLKNPDDLKKLALYAEQIHYLEAQIEIWELVVSKNPRDASAWRQLGQAAFEAHDNCRALSAIEQFFALDTSHSCMDWGRSLYEYGEILRKQRERRGAKKRFLSALCYLDQVPQTNYSMRELQALLLNKLNTRGSDPLGIMETVYWMSGRNPDIGADYANLLMDAGCLSKATHLLRENACEP